MLGALSPIWKSVASPLRGPRFQTSRREGNGRTTGQMIMALVSPGRRSCCMKETITLVAAFPAFMVYFSSAQDVFCL